MRASYRSYLLRLWLEQNDPPVWRAMLESPVDGERHGFPSLQALFAFLEKEAGRLEQGDDLAQTHKNKENQQGESK